MSWKIAVAAGDLPLYDVALALVLALLLFMRLCELSASVIAVLPVLVPKFVYGIFHAAAFVLASTSALGHLILYHFYQHAVTTVFNADVRPKLT